MWCRLYILVWMWSNRSSPWKEVVRGKLRVYRNVKLLAASHRARFLQWCGFWAFQMFYLLQHFSHLWWQVARAFFFGQPKAMCCLILSANENALSLSLSFFLFFWKVLAIFNLLLQWSILVFWLRNLLIIKPIGVFSV